MTKRLVFAFSIVLLCVLVVVLPASAQFEYPGEGEWGDAPDGFTAYPDLGVGGNFPTCFTGVLGHWIFHGMGNMYFGLGVDYETDGNAAQCPPPPYDRDECWGPSDGDGGLVSPDPFTIGPGNTYDACGQPAALPLGAPCQVLNLTVGGPFEANIVNTTGVPGFVNVLFDWNQDGEWGGTVMCGAAIPEHAIVNLPVPGNYVGPLSGLHPGPIQVGPNAGYVWMRMSIMNEAVGPAWDGRGLFDLGETEDYIVRVDDDVAGEYGDAPEGALAYPNGVIGSFPTCRLQPQSAYVFHAMNDGSHFGQGFDFEGDGNANQCPAPPYDQDECDVLGNDAGLLFPDPLTLDPTGGVLPCTAGNTHVRWNTCQRSVWGTHIDIALQNLSSQDQFVNVLVDWDQDGAWTANTWTCPGGNVGSEHVLVDHVVPAGFQGKLSDLAPPTFLTGPAEGYVWVRFSLTEVAVGQNWDGSGRFDVGETEDYLLQIDAVPTAAPALPDLREGARIDRVQPNPFNPRTTVHFRTAEAGAVRLTVVDVVGRRVATLLERDLPVGAHQVMWAGVDDRGETLPSGVYFARIEMKGPVDTAKLVLLK